MSGQGMSYLRLAALSLSCKVNFWVTQLSKRCTDDIQNITITVLLLPTARHDRGWYALWATNKTYFYHVALPKSTEDRN